MNDFEDPVKKMMMIIATINAVLIGAVAVILAFALFVMFKGL